jgi:mannose-6-phosphate isomerase-like protein (cupin superfamily)
MNPLARWLAFLIVVAPLNGGAQLSAQQSGDEPVAIEMRGVPEGKHEPTVLIFKSGDYAKFQIPNPGEPFRPEILTADQGAGRLGGMFGVLPSGSQVAYHYHVNRESVIIAISGEATEVIEGKELPFKTGDIYYIPPGKKHTTINRTNADFRYLEFFTYPPMASDFVEVK